MNAGGNQVTNSELPWYREINAYQWRTLILAILGYTLDAMDFLMYALVMGLIMKEFAISGATAGFIATVVLIAASAGGYIFGVLTDYIGRARTLVFTVIIYSAGTFGSAFSHSWVELLLWRCLLGLGMGGEWGPGIALVVETWPVKHRAKALGMVQCSCRMQAPRSRRDPMRRPVQFPHPASAAAHRPVAVVSGKESPDDKARCCAAAAANRPRSPTCSARCDDDNRRRK